MTDEDGGTAYRFYVRPLGIAGCPNVAVELARRVCGSGGRSCGVTARGDRDTACTETSAGWYCNDATGHALPAILTRLKLGDVKALYGGCPSLGAGADAPPAPDPARQRRGRGREA